MVVSAISDPFSASAANAGLHVVAGSAARAMTAARMLERCGAVIVNTAPRASAAANTLCWKPAESIRTHRFTRSRTAVGIAAAHSRTNPARVDGHDLFHRCIFVSETCDEHNPCPLHDTWAPIMASTIDAMSKTTLADLAIGMAEQGRP